MITQELTNRRYKTVRSFTWIGAAALLIFSFDNFYAGITSIAIIELSLSIGLILNIFIYRLHKNTILAGYISSFLILCLLFILYVTGGISGNTGVYWYFVFPVIVLFLLDRPGAYLFLLTLVAGTTGLYLASKMGYIQVSLNLLETRQLLAALTVECLLIARYVTDNSSYLAKIEEQQQSLIAAEASIFQKEAELRAEKDLLSDKEAIMERNKVATLNLLEDSRELEKQLQEEKASVEKKVEERTRELNNIKARLDSSIKNLPLAFLMTDLKEEVVVTNPLAEKLLGGKNSNENLFNLKELIKSRLDLSPFIQRCGIEKKRVVLSDIEFNSRILRILLSPILTGTAEESCLGVVVLIQDVTEEKNLERSKDEFFSIASHELRTPLTAIRGNTSMILQDYADTIKDPELKSMVEDVHESSIRLIDIVNDFLNVSRLEQGKMVYDLKPIQLAELIPTTVKEFMNSGILKQLNLVYLPPSNPLPEVLADIDKVREVIINLLGNAAKFTSNGSIKIITQVAPKFVRVLVSDTGRGIPEKQQSLLFHKFQQATSSIFTRDTVGGTGLGLYISRMMIEAMGGELKLEESTEGKGSTFSLTLPIATDDNQIDRLAQIGLKTSQVDKPDAKL